MLCKTHNIIVIIILGFPLSATC